MKKRINDRKNNKTVEKLFKFDFANLSRAIRAFHYTASTGHGADCVSMAKNASALLNQYGLSTNIAIGDAMWRVDGKDGGACITHAPQMETYTTLGTSGNIAPIHAWVTLNEVWNIDFSTYQFEMKMRQLDSADGKKTPVSWHPNYLAFKNSEISTFSEVQNGFTDALIYYKARRELSEGTYKNIVDAEADAQDVANLDRIFYAIKYENVEYIQGPEGSISVSDV